MNLHIFVHKPILLGGIMKLTNNIDNNSILDSLLNFVSAKDQFAIMLDGPWGSGKTYFLKNKVIPQLQIKHKVVYFSVYGYENLSELKIDLINNLFISSIGLDLENNATKENIKDAKRIAKGLFSVFGNKLSVFKPLANAASEFTIRKQLQEQSKKKVSVLVIDDLERINNSIKISDFLGFLLTNIIESYGYRVIIVGNSKEIISNEPERFNKIYEKTISRIIPFSYDIKSVKRDFFEKSEINYLKNDSIWLVNILAEYVQNNKDQFNLRTLQFILETFDIIDQSLDKYLGNCHNEGKKVDSIKRSAFLNLFVIANEYREGRLVRGDLYQLGNILNTRDFHFIHLNENEEKSKAEQITLRYHHDKTLSENIIYTNEINNVVFNGVFDAQKFVENWSELFSTESNTSNLSKLSYFREMNDVQLKELQETLLEEFCDSGETSGNILSLINNFVFFEENGIYLADKPYLKILLDLLAKAVNKEVILQDGELFDESLIAFLYTAIARNKKVMEHVKHIVKSVNDKKSKNIAQKLLHSIFSKDYETQRKILIKGFKINIFREIINSKFLYEDLLVKGSKAPMLNQYLNSEYIGILNIKDFHKNETLDLEKFINDVEAFLKYSAEIDKIDQFNLKNLLKTLQDINNKLSD